MKHKVSELDGALLDLAVALAEGYGDAIASYGGFSEWAADNHWAPSTSWDDGGEIIERERLMLEPPWTPNAGGNGVWLAWTEFDMSCGSGDSPLVGAMRCYVLSKLGEEVEF